MVGVFVFFISICLIVNNSLNALRLYQCKNNQCQLVSVVATQNLDGTSMSECLLTCGEINLWPYPYEVIEKGIEVYPIEYDLLSYKIIANDNHVHYDTNLQSMMQIQWKTFMESIKANIPTKQPFENKKYAPMISINIKNVKESNLTLSTDESYNLQIDTDTEKKIISVKISAPNYFGARHGLETLSQLIAWDEFRSSLIILGNVLINDTPAFKYRGVMLDVARHFLPLLSIENTIRAMSFNKMNVLHLHLTDTASFPLVIQNQPKLSQYGAYSDEHTYSKKDMKYLSQFALSHGILIIPEIDSPAHVGAGWEWGADDPNIGTLTLCSDTLGKLGEQWSTDSLEPPSGQLNLANENIYPILEDIYKEVIENLGTSGRIFHLGGDEVLVGSDESWAACYNSTKLGEPIIKMINDLGLDRKNSESFYALWQNFTKRVTDIVVKEYDLLSNPTAQKVKLHIWGGSGTSDVTYNMIMRPNVVDILPPSLFNIQVWDSSDVSISKWLIRKGYDVILSNTDYVYLDCGNAGFANPGGYWCQPYHEWFHIYGYVDDVIAKWKLSANEISKILGSETLPWAEMIDSVNLEQKVWPRSAALAEALWSGPKFTSLKGWYGADFRMQLWRNKLVKRGINAEPLQPLWCQQRGSHSCTLQNGTPQ